MKRSFRAAVNAKCKDCIYDRGTPGTWRMQVGLCTSSNCPLHDYRPLPENAAELAEKRAKNDRTLLMEG